MQISVSNNPAEILPTNEQLEMLARRLMPEIKKLFADDVIRQEFAEWKKRQK